MTETVNCEFGMQRENVPRSGRFATAVACGAVVAMALVIVTGSPAWVVVFLIFAVVMAIVWPTEEIQYDLAWRNHSVPMPSWRYWLVSGIAYLSFVGMIGALFVRERGLGIVCAAVSLVSQFARMVMRSRRIGKSLNLPRRPGPSPWHRRIFVGSLVGYVAMLLAMLLGQQLFAFVVGVPVAVSLLVLTLVKRRQDQRLLENVLRERAAPRREENDQDASSPLPRNTT